MSQNINQPIILSLLENVPTADKIVFRLIDKKQTTIDGIGGLIISSERVINDYNNKVKKRDIMEFKSMTTRRREKK